MRNIGKINMSNKIEFIIVSEFETEDDFGSDAIGYHVELNGETIAEYGDWYHDKGSEKCEGFIDSYTKSRGITSCSIKYEERAGYSI